MHKYKLLKSASFIGGLISVLLSLLLLFIGATTPVESFIIGLLATIVSLCVDIIYQINNAKLSILNQNEIGINNISNKTAKENLLLIIKNIQSIQDKNLPKNFTERALSSLEECRNITSQINEGSMEVEPLGAYTFGISGFKNINNSIKATSYINSTHFWQSPIGKKYMATNKESAERGVNIHRVFIVSEKHKNEVKPIIDELLRNKTKVSVAFEENLEPSFYEDYLIADDQILVKLELNKDGVAINERISCKDVDLKNARTKFTKLVEQSLTVEEAYG